MMNPVGQPIATRLSGRPRRLTHLFATLLAATLITPAARAELKWPDGPYNYIALDQELRDALLEFGRNIGVMIKVSDAVRGRLRNVMPAPSAQDFLRRLCDNHGLVWSFDGSVLHVNTVGEVKTDVFPLGGRMTIEEARERLRKLDLDDPRYPLRSSGDGVISISGPPPYLARLREALGAPVPKEVPAPAPSVQVIRAGN